MTEATGGATAAPNTTVLDVLNSSGVGSALNQPVSEVLSGLNLPALPQLPSITLPDLSGIQMPTLPTIDPTTLISPVISLISSFGSGTLGTALTSIFSAVSSALSSSSTASTAATTAVSSGWQGVAAQAAEVKSKEVETNVPGLLAQAENLKVILLEAEQIVAEGYAELSALIARFVGEVIAGMTFLLTPAGLPYLITMATDAVSEAGAITAKTRVQLSASTVAVTGAGTKLLIAGAPTAADAASLANQVSQAMSPFVSVGTQVAEKVVEKGSSVVTSGASAVSSAISSITSSNSTTTTTTTSPTTTTTTKTNDEKTTEKTPTDTTTTTTGGGLDTGGSGIVSGMPNGGSPSSPLSGSRIPTSEVSSGTPTGRSLTSNKSNSTTTVPSMMSPSAAGAGRAGDAGESDVDRMPNLVTGAHGDEVVGLIEGVSIPVVGAIEAVDEPPDKALTL
ncbi:hypothetical protein AB0N05_22000 [Nocardia sp. NPDC051030]|uniref:hypothetical protein n=1 Tax=Nocardia sp. NPDC051030 TaxID=3155162 RepID=UPI003428F221